MRLLIISNMDHFIHDDVVYGHGPTVREIDHLCALFEEVEHIAFLHLGAPYKMALPYTADNFSFTPVSPSGGSTLWSKIGILFKLPLYAARCIASLSKADLVHVRCPCNIGLMAILILALRSKPEKRWVKYAGSWASNENEAISYKIQRWLLRHNWHRGIVSVNGEWVDQPDHVYSLLNPCLTDEEIDSGRVSATSKVLVPPLELLFIGRVETAKGVGRVIDVSKMLLARGIGISLVIIGQGDPGFYKQYALSQGIGDYLVFLGDIPRNVLPEYLTKAHFLLLPSSSEGWPKVLSEGMAYGVVPIASNVGSIPSYLDKFGVGGYFEPDDLEGYVAKIVSYINNPDSWKSDSMRGMSIASDFSYMRYQSTIKQLLGL